MMKIFLSALIACCLFACDKKPEFREYSEVHKPFVPPENNPAPQMGQGQLPPSNSPSVNLSYQTPAAWVETKGSNGMRIAGFHDKTKEDKFLCTLIKLGGTAGGIKSNITRWLGQLEISIEDTQLDAFIANAKSIPGIPNSLIFDFSLFESSKSMLAAIIPVKDATLFLKLSATKDIVIEERKNFNDLASSIKL